MKPKSFKPLSWRPLNNTVEMQRETPTSKRIDRLKADKKPKRGGVNAWFTKHGEKQRADLVEQQTRTASGINILLTTEITDKTLQFQSDHLEESLIAAAEVATKQRRRTLEKMDSESQVEKAALELGVDVPTYLEIKKAYELCQVDLHKAEELKRIDFDYQLKNAQEQVRLALNLTHLETHKAIYVLDRLLEQIQKRYLLSKSEGPKELIAEQITEMDKIIAGLKGELDEFKRHRLLQAGSEEDAGGDSQNTDDGSEPASDTKTGHDSKAD